MLRYQSITYTIPACSQDPKKIQRIDHYFKVKEGYVQTRKGYYIKNISSICLTIIWYYRPDKGTVNVISCDMRGIVNG